MTNFKLTLAAFALVASATAGANVATSNSSSSNLDVSDTVSGTTHDAGNATTTNTGATSGAMKMAPKSDAEIAAILEAANQAEIQAAQVAQKNGSNADVKTFATTMLSAHKSNDSRGDALASRLKIKQSASNTSRDLAKNSQAKIDDMKNKKGAEFDRAYIDSQVSMHSQLASDLEQTLIPAAKNTEFKSFLQETLTHVRSHLTEAQKLQASMGTGTTSDSTSAPTAPADSSGSSGY